jgi:hypothetical protein
VRIRGLVVGLFALVSGPFWTFAAVGAAGSVAEEDGFAARVASERSGAGLTPYAGAGDLVDVARRHAARMAAEGRLHHNPSLGSEVQDWEAVGENVGVGASVDDIHRAFMASASHRHAILSTAFTEVGLGVAFGPDGRLWVAQVFRRPMAAAAPAPAPAAAPAAKVAARSAPAPRPAPDPAALAAARAARAAEAAAAEHAAIAAAAEADRAAAARAAEAEGIEVAERLAANLAVGASVGPPAPAVLARVEVAAADPSVRRVTLPVGLAASALLAVVLGLLAEVTRGSARYPLSDWRRQRNQASISSSRSPSSTAWTLPVS